ncbi:hypothetical protein WICMUC_005089 [Wickerhamomyces mucosus]|uniref:Eisosome protein SEG1 n=1 Tax=Wickerhamomyces mucosus TaxID=1378264 RepID=A0A9P8T8E7_9ASCO|nr:hypothetical protein WICMUC_005089 [Wickerhamomyces mucosus]
MFSSRRKSQPISQPSALPGGVTAAGAIGIALKTGQPIPRSNSLQRTSSIQRASLSNGRPGSRLSSLSSFSTLQSQQRIPNQGAPQRSQSLISQKKIVSKKSNISLPPKPIPKTIKKHVPGPYGLITIEVPFEEANPTVNQQQQSQPKRRIKPTNRSSDNHSIKSINSNTSNSRRLAFQESIPEDDVPQFNSPTKGHPIVSTQELGGISEQEDLELLQSHKQSEESEILKDLSIQEKEINDKLNSINTELQELESLTDAPSTSKTQYSDNEQSTIDTEISDDVHFKQTENDGLSEPSKITKNSMAQQLRSTIPLLSVPNGVARSVEQESIIDTQDVVTNSSIYSSDANESASTKQEISNSEVPLEKNISVSEIPERSVKRVAPKKSALKIKSNSSLSLNDPVTQISSPKNPANAAYLSLTTAENTRLNAINSSQTSARSRSNSRASVNVTSKIQQSRPQSSYERESPIKSKGPERPQSVANFKQAKKLNQTQRTSTIPKSVSNAAALNATLQKKEIPKPKLQRSSSFEKNRNGESNAGFKRKSLRDPSFAAGPQTFESNLGFYKNQSAIQQRQQQNQPNRQPTQNNTIRESPREDGFRSRFDDSDSDSEVPLHHNRNAATQRSFQPPPTNSTLRKPKSHFSLRSASNSAAEASPAKSLPPNNDPRKTRFFSDNLQQQQSLKQDEKKKSGLGGKLKKLFGRSNHKQ